MVIVVLAGILWLVSLGMLVVPKIKDKTNDKSYSLKPYSFIPFGIAVLMLFFGSFNVVGASDVGVPVAFGHAHAAVGPGIHVKAPWVHIKSMSTKLQNYTMSSASTEGSKLGDDSVPVHTKDQVTVNVDSTTLFNLDRAKAEYVYVHLGSDYITQVVRPIIRSAIRDNATPYNAIDLATDDRANYQAAVQSQIEAGLGKYGIIVGGGGVQIRDIHLPATIQDAVNAKAKAQQDVAQQQFVLQSKQAQAQQRIVDARGLAQAQTIIHSTLNPEYLQYLYITTMQDLAKSPNTTFMFLPNDPGALPTFQLPLKDGGGVK